MLKWARTKQAASEYLVERKSHDQKMSKGIKKTVNWTVLYDDMLADES